MKLLTTVMFYVLVPVAPLNLSKLTASDAVEFILYGGKYGTKKITATVSESYQAEDEEKTKRYYANFTLPEVFFCDKDVFVKKENWNLSLPFNHTFIGKEELQTYHAVMKDGTSKSNPFVANFPASPQTLALLAHVTNVQIQYLNKKYVLKSNAKALAEFISDGKKFDDIKILVTPEEISELIENSTVQVAIATGATAIAYNKLKAAKEGALAKNMNNKQKTSIVIPNYNNLM